MSQKRRGDDSVGVTAKRQKLEPKSYAELQRRCKKVGIKANQKASVLRPLLRAAEGRIHARPLSVINAAAKATSPASRPPSPPREFVCSLTLELMHDPVSDRNGDTFEHAAIVEALTRTPLSPLTRAPSSVADLHPNRALRDSIERWRLAHSLGPIPVDASPMPLARRAVKPSAPRAAARSTDALLAMLSYGAQQRAARAAAVEADAARRRTEALAAKWRAALNRELRYAGVAALGLYGLWTAASLPDTFFALLATVLCFAALVYGVWALAVAPRAGGYPSVAALGVATLIATSAALHLLLPVGQPSQALLNAWHLAALALCVAVYGACQHTLSQRETARGTVLSASVAPIVVSQLAWHLAHTAFVPRHSHAAAWVSMAKLVAVLVSFAWSGLYTGIVVLSSMLRPAVDALVQPSAADHATIAAMLAASPSKHASKAAFAAAAIASFAAWLARCEWEICRPAAAACLAAALLPGYREVRRIVRSRGDVYPTALALGLALASSFTASTALVVLNCICRILLDVIVGIIVGVLHVIYFLIRPVLIVGTGAALITVLICATRPGF